MTGATTGSATESPADSKIDPAVRKAARDWASTVLGAPTRFDALLTGMAVRDEVIRRVVTHVTCRTLRERRGQAGARRTAWRAEVSKHQPVDQIDPFAHTVDSLRAATEHVGSCSTCVGAGQMSCDPCKGSGRTTCSRCWGTGKQRSEKTGRPINCKVCKKAGKVACAHCGSSGRVTCSACTGSGQELVWTTFEETTRWEVALEPDDAVAKAHPALRKATPLEARDCPGLLMAQSIEAQGPLSSAQLAQLSPSDRSFVETRARVHPRFERVAFQQAMRLEVVRRDLEFEMCGTRGTLVLSGDQMTGASTAEALRPVHRRMVWWVGLFVLLLGVTAMMRSAMLGESRYFDELRGPTTVLLLLAMAAVVPALGGVLRSWRGGLRRWPLRLGEKLLGVIAVSSWLGMCGVGAAGRPDAAKVGAALRAGDAVRAREIFDALKEIRGESPEVANLEDEVLLAEAGKAKSAERLALLERVASHQGRKAQEAQGLLSNGREQEIRRLTATGNPQQALATAKLWYPSDAGRTPEILQAMAEAADAVAATCKDAACRISAQRASTQYAPTPARQAALVQTRSELLARFAEPQETIQPAQQLERLVALRSLDMLAEQTLAVVLPEDELALRATSVRSRVAALRQSVALIGARREIVDELLGDLQQKDPLVWSVEVEGASVYAVFDRNGLCRGLYVTNRSGKRALPLSTGERLLSQAAGRAATIRAPQSEQVTALRWSVGAVRAMARGSGGEVFELRIGSADP